MAKYYGCVLGKSLVALPTPAAVWVVLSEPTVAADFAWLPRAWLVLPTLLFLLFCYAIVRWAVADQHLRCHVCLRPLRMPVSLGRLGSILFELPATEYICPHGHGTLHVPEPPINEMDGPKWKPQDDAWETLLVTAKK
jgi:hypothetical protein